MISRLKGKVVLLQVSDFGLGRGLYISKALSLSGLSVTIITNQRVFNSSSPVKKTKPKSNELRIKELNIPFGRFLYGSTLGKLFFYLYFTLFSFLKIINETPQPKILYSRGPHPFTEISCILYRLFHTDATIISDTTDLWPDAVKYIKMSEFSKKILIGVGEFLNHLVYRRIDLLVTHNNEIAKILEYRFKLKPCVIFGVIDLKTFKPINLKQSLETFSQEIQKRFRNKFIVLYAGLLGPFQNPSSILKLAESLSNVPEIIFVIAGEGPLKKELLSEINVKGLQNIVFLKTVSFEKMPYVYNVADICLNTYAEFDLLSTGLPKKIIEYSACGKPILCMSPPCVASKLCLRYKAGFQVGPKEIEKASEIIKKLMCDPLLIKSLSENSRIMAEDLFSLNGAAEKLVFLINSQKKD